MSSSNSSLKDRVLVSFNKFADNIFIWIVSYQFMSCIISIIVNKKIRKF